MKPLSNRRMKYDLDIDAVQWLEKIRKEGEEKSGEHISRRKFTRDLIDFFNGVITVEYDNKGKYFKIDWIKDSPKKKKEG